MPDITYVQAVFPDGQVWKFPAQHIAEHRAADIATRDPLADYDVEVAYALSDIRVLEEWLVSDMEFSEIRRFATQVKAAKPMPLDVGLMHDETEITAVYE